MSLSFLRAARLVLFLAALLSLPSCVSSRAFLPTEHVTGFNPRGDLFASEYPLVERGQSLAEVKVWTNGAVRDASDDDPRTRVRVGFELTNHGEAPIRLDPRRLQLEELPKPGAPPGRTPAAKVDGDTLVPPGQTRQINVAFDLPSSVWPSDVPGYRVAWSVVGERVHSRKTPFRRAADVRAPDPWSPYFGSYYGWYPPGLTPGFYGGWPYRYRYWPWRGPRIYYLPR